MTLLDRLSESQGHRCCYCGVRFSDDPLSPDHATRDHIVPRSKGGLNGFHHLVAACWSCNNTRGNEDAVAFYEACVQERRTGSRAPGAPGVPAGPVLSQVEKLNLHRFRSLPARQQDLVYGLAGALWTVRREAGLDGVPLRELLPVFLRVYAVSDDVLAAMAEACAPHWPGDA